MDGMQGMERMDGWVGGWMDGTDGMSGHGWEWMD